MSESDHQYQSNTLKVHCILAFYNLLTCDFLSFEKGFVLSLKTEINDLVWRDILTEFIEPRFIFIAQLETIIHLINLSNPFLK